MELLRPIPAARDLSSEVRQDQDSNSSLIITAHAPAAGHLAETGRYRIRGSSAHTDARRASRLSLSNLRRTSKGFEHRIECSYRLRLEPSAAARVGDGCDSPLQWGSDFASGGARDHRQHFTGEATAQAGIDLWFQPIADRIGYFTNSLFPRIVLASSANGFRAQHQLFECASGGTLPYPPSDCTHS